MFVLVCLPILVVCCKWFPAPTRKEIINFLSYHTVLRNICLFFYSDWHWLSSRTCTVITVETILIKWSSDHNRFQSWSLASWYQCDASLYQKAKERNILSQGSCRITRLVTLGFVFLHSCGHSLSSNLSNTPGVIVRLHERWRFHLLTNPQTMTDLMTNRVLTSWSNSSYQMVRTAAPSLKTSHCHQSTKSGCCTIFWFLKIATYPLWKHWSSLIWP